MRIKDTTEELKKICIGDMDFGQCFKHISRRAQLCMVIDITDVDADIELDVDDYVWYINITNGMVYKEDDKKINVIPYKVESDVIGVGLDEDDI